MGTNKRWGEWGRGPPLSLFHFFPPRWSIAICHHAATLDAPRLETHFAPPNPETMCKICHELYLSETTPEAALIRDATGLLWLQADSHLRKLAIATAEKNSLLAIELERARQRVDALYAGGEPAI